MKVPHQGSWRKVFKQTYSQQMDNKEQAGTLENLFSIQKLKISFIGFVIVPVMCILCLVTRCKHKSFQGLVIRPMLISSDQFNLRLLLH